MVQARRNRQAARRGGATLKEGVGKGVGAKMRRSRGGGKGGMPNVVVLVLGLVSGSLGTMLWQGAMKSDEEGTGNLGAGIRRIMEHWEIREVGGEEVVAEVVGDGAEGGGGDAKGKGKTDYTFYTVLPEIEVVVPPTPPAEDGDEDAVAGGQPIVDVPTSDSALAAYFLQVGSYRQQREAERLKAQLALHGMVARVQKVSVQGRGKFFRVRLGPYTSYEAMLQADSHLRGIGVTGALRLKRRAATTAGQQSGAAAL